NEQSEQFFKEAIDVRTRALGPQHIDLAESLQGYADLLKNNYREAEAEHMLACARAIIDHNKAKDSSLQGIS
ncbi:MAG TPA: tetratricopeptide repeat protein, partial [Candidatus Melainabacteria bacterium]|nr:tetratricopeptide repeat protein [Candidatus Melainabacteria bacterium]